MKYICSLAIIILGSFVSRAQNVLPDIMVRELTKGKVQISWNNPYESCNQLAIQRSTDSSANFRTIFSSQSPELPSNGYVDNKPIRGIKSYYRIFYVLEGGAYYFSKVVAIELRWSNPVMGGTIMGNMNEPAKNMISIINKGAVVFQLTKDGYNIFRDSINHRTKDDLSRINANTIEWKPAPVKRDHEMVTVFRKEQPIARLTPAAYKLFRDSVTTTTKDSLYMIDPYRIQLRPFVKNPDFISVYRNDSLLRELPFGLYQQFRDSIAGTTRDTLFLVNNARLDIHPFLPRYAWRPSSYVFTNGKGYLTIMLPLVKQHKYRIVFYDIDSSELFQLKSLKEPELVLDKANFMHAGWFSFELFEDDKLKEKNKFFLAKDQ